MGKPGDLDFGPWWWRLRCRVAEFLADASAAVEPDDRRTVSWTEGGFIHFAQVRRQDHRG